MRKKSWGLWLVLALMAFATMVGGCGGGGGGDDDDDDGNNITGERKPYFPDYVYETVKTTVSTMDIYAGQENIIEITQSDFTMAGLKIEMPAGAIDKDATLVFNNVINPPLPPEGYFFVRPFVEISGVGKLNAKANASIPYKDEYLEERGVTNPNMLEVFVYFEDDWHKQTVLSIDRNMKVVNVELEAFGYISLGCQSFVSTIPAASARSQEFVSRAKAPQDVKPGDIIFKHTWAPIVGWQGNYGLGWLPGHVGIYVGEKIDSEGHRYNVIESLPSWGEYVRFDGVQRNYYTPLSLFGTLDNANYMGAFSPARDITDKQREIIVATAEFHVGTPYSMQSMTDRWLGLGMADEAGGKGSVLPNSHRDRINCVGLAELSMEAAGINGGNGYFDGGWMTPEGLFNKLVSIEILENMPTPKIEWVNLTPTSGSPDTPAILKAYISNARTVNKVYYEIEGTGYYNPTVNAQFNDVGMYDDELFGDGIYTTSGTLGGTPGSSYQLRVYAIGISGVTVESDLITVNVTGYSSARTSQGQSVELNSRLKNENGTRLNLGFNE